MALSKKETAVQTLISEINYVKSSLIEGVTIDFDSMEDIFNWEVVIFGPPMTPYEGGYFKAHLSFPNDYPEKQPLVRFISKIFHPNINENGILCYNNFVEDTEDSKTHDVATKCSQRIMNVRYVLRHINFLLNEPNLYSIANDDAARLYCKWDLSNGRSEKYMKKVRADVRRTYADAKADGVVVPTKVTTGNPFYERRDEKNNRWFEKCVIM